jgi:hypothetical protein
MEGAFPVPFCFSWRRSRGFNDAAAFISTGMLNTGAARGAT